MRKKGYIFLLLLLLLGPFGFTQGEANVWYFGNTGLKFPLGGGVPSVLTSNLSSFGKEGVTTIADAAGDLLFYTDGVTIFDKLGGTMANGTGIAGGYTSSQMGIIIPDPGNKKPILSFYSCLSRKNRKFNYARTLLLDY